MSQMLPPSAPSQGDPSQGAGPAPAPAGAPSNYASNNDPALSLLKPAEQSILAFISKEVDPAKKQQGSKLLALCHSLLASGESDNDTMLGLTPQLKAVQRLKALQSQGGQGA